MNDWLNSPVVAAIAGAIAGAFSTYFFGLKRDKRLGKLENENKKLKKDNKEMKEKQVEDKREIRAETKELLKELEKRVRLEEEKKIIDTLYSVAERGRNDLQKEKDRLRNESNQLWFALTWCGIDKKELGIDGNISVIEWEKKPEIQRKKKEMIKSKR